MTDKELLESAAKAAGIEYQGIDEKFGVYLFWDEPTDKAYWNPLKDDGDALRLAVRLKLPLNFLNRQTARCTPTNKYEKELWVDCGRYWDSFDLMYYPFSEKYGDDPYAATRRASAS